MKLLRWCWIVGCVGWLAHAAGPAADKNATDFFGLTNVWSLHLKLSAADWDHLNPTEPARGDRPDRPDRPEGPGRPPRPEFAPGDRPPPGVRPGGRPPGPPGPPHREFPWSSATVEFGPEVFTNVSVRFKGNSSFNGSRNSLKKPLKLDFDRQVPGRTFFGLEELLLNNNVNELAHLREPLAYDAFRRADLPAPRTAFVQVHLTVTGQFENRHLGLYTAVEPVEGDFLKHTFATRHGLLVKPEGIRGLEYFGEDWHAYTNRYEVKSKLTSASARRLVDLTRFVHQASEAEFDAHLGDYLDVESTLRFVALNALLANLDSFLGNGHNYYLFLPDKARPARFIPWDLNEAFGGHPMAGDSRAQAEFSVLQPTPPGNRFVGRLLAQPARAARYREICASLLTNAFNAPRLIADAERIRQATAESLAREPRQPGRRGGPGFGPPEERPEGARPATDAPANRPPPNDPMRRGRELPIAEWIRLRDANVRAELAGQRTSPSPTLGHFPGGPPPPRPE